MKTFTVWAFSFYFFLFRKQEIFHAKICRYVVHTYLLGIMKLRLAFFSFIFKVFAIFFLYTITIVGTVATVNLLAFLQGRGAFIYIFGSQFFDLKPC